MRTPPTKFNWKCRQGKTTITRDKKIIATILKEIPVNIMIHIMQGLSTGYDEGYQQALSDMNLTNLLTTKI